METERDTKEIKNITSKIKYLDFDSFYSIPLKKGENIRLIENNKSLKQEVLEGRIVGVFYDENPWENKEMYKKNKIHFDRPFLYYLKLECLNNNSARPRLIIGQISGEKCNSLYLTNYSVERIDS
jgi:hypothetical protein